MITPPPPVLLLAAVMLVMPQFTSAASRKPPEELPVVRELPDPFAFNDGSRVKAPADWPRRRAELLELVQAYEYGHLPPAAPVSATQRRWEPNAKALEREAKREPQRQPLPDGATETHLLLTTGPDGKIEIPLVLTRPAGTGPFPVIIRGDLCWGRVQSSVAAEAVRRGYMLAEFDRTAVAPDDKGPGRTAGLYPLYPDHDAAALAAWAWGFHRVADYLLTRGDVRKDHLAVTGHSRGGKAALLAGATDERIALTAPNNSGAGGAGCFRVQGPNSETLERITRVFPHWFQASFHEFGGDNVVHLPIDQHSVKALIAPRALLGTEALGDLWANPSGSQQTHLAAREVYAFLGAPEAIGIVFRDGVHEHNVEDWNVLLDFADEQWFGKQTGRAFDKLAFPDAPRAHSWAAPAAERR